MDTEIWKPVFGYENSYEVSNLWIVKSKKTLKPLKWSSTWNWYLKIKVKKENWTRNLIIHRLIAQSFIPNPENKPCVNHINWIKTDNRVENLEWVTYSENMKHAYKTSLHKQTENNFFKRNAWRFSKWKFWKDSMGAKTIIQYDLLWNIIKEWWSIIDVKRTLWFSKSSISACCRWKYKTSYGFIWKYK